MGDIDILVLPEMAFTGYVFNSKEEIYPYLEDSETGPSVTWAKRQGITITHSVNITMKLNTFKIAIRLQCYVVVGYPQKDGKLHTIIISKRLYSNATQRIGDTYYNSLCFVDSEGIVVKTYQKTFLYETDENWAIEGPGFVSFDTHKFGKVFCFCMKISAKKKVLTSVL